jgi:hypothetical protein
MTHVDDESRSRSVIYKFYTLCYYILYVIYKFTQIYL